MKKRAFTFIILAGLVTMLAGCEEPLNWDRIKGRQVQFEVSSRSDVKTKTSYSDAFYTEGGRNFERINWVTGDQIRIYSSNTAKVSSNIGDYYDYSIASVTPNDRRSDAKLTQPAAGEGLIWVDDPYDVTFYGTYPPMERLYENDNKTLLYFTGMSIPSAQAPAWSGRVGTPDMSYAYMVSAPATFQGTAVDGETVPKMHMDFYPLFNAFYFVLASQDNEIQLNSLTLTSANASSYLSGSFKYTVNTLTASGPTVTGVSHVGDNGTGVSVNFPSGTKISATDSVKVTVLTLPPQSGTAISNLTLTINYDDGRVAELPLKYSNGNPLQFPAFHKARITGLAMKGGVNWRLKVDDLPWNLVEMETTFSQNIQSSPFVISNAKETGNNYYPAGTKDYQVRTLDMDAGKTFFEVEFTPQAPLGGYWQLIPESNGGLGTAAFKVELWDDEGSAGTDLKGHIMNQDVKFHITSNVTDAQRTEDHAIIIKVIFSTSITFDENSTFSADSEIQDVHRDGSFSYWRFVIPQKIN